MSVKTLTLLISKDGDYGSRVTEVTLACLEEFIIGYGTSYEDLTENLYSHVTDEVYDLRGDINLPVLSDLIDSRQDIQSYIEELTIAAEYSLKRIYDNNWLLLNNMFEKEVITDVSTSMTTEHGLLMEVSVRR